MEKNKLEEQYNQGLEEMDKDFCTAEETFKSFDFETDMNPFNMDFNFEMPKMDFSFDMPEMDFNIPAPKADVIPDDELITTASSLDFNFEIPDTSFSFEMPSFDMSIDMSIFEDVEKQAVLERKAAKKRAREEQLAEAKRIREEKAAEERRMREEIRMREEKAAEKKRLREERLAEKKRIRKEKIVKAKSLCEEKLAAVKRIREDRTVEKQGIKESRETPKHTHIKAVPKHGKTGSIKTTAEARILQQLNAKKQDEATAAFDILMAEADRIVSEEETRLNLVADEFDKLVSEADSFESEISSAAEAADRIATGDEKPAIDNAPFEPERLLAAIKEIKQEDAGWKSRLSAFTERRRAIWKKSWQDIAAEYKQGEENRAIDERNACSATERNERAEYEHLKLVRQIARENFEKSETEKKQAESDSELRRIRELTDQIKKLHKKLSNTKQKWHKKLKKPMSCGYWIRRK